MERAGARGRKEERARACARGRKEENAANSCSRILPGERKKRHTRTAVLLLGAIIAAAAPAGAGNEPELVSTHPAAEGSARSADVPGVTATYDRDIDGLHSWMKLFDAADNQVTGVGDLAGPPSETGGKRTIRFTPYTPLSELRSPYRARAKVRPLGGGGDTITEWTFEIDDTAPAPPAITDPSDGEARDDQPVVALGTAEAGALVEILEGTAAIASDGVNDLGGFAVVLPYGPEDGVTHTIQGVAVDPAGNRSAPSVPVTFVHDSVEVTPVIVTPHEGAHLPATSVLVSGTAKAGATVTVSEAGAPVGTAMVNAEGEWETTISFSEGVHVITAEAFDGVNVDGPSPARTFTVDLTAPAAPTIIQPAEGAVVGTNGVVVGGTAEPRTLVQVREGAAVRARLPVNEAGGWQGTITFSDGAHTITAVGEDLAGNVGPAGAPRTFTVDTAAPAPPVITQPAQDAFLATSVVTVAGTAEANTSVHVVRGTVTIGIATASGTGAWSVAITFDDGAHSIHAVAVDAAGNVSQPSAPRGFTVDTVAPAPPVILRPGEGSEVESTDVVVSGTAEPGVTVEVIEGSTVLATRVADGERRWSVTVTMTPGPHTIVARATDRAGNVSAPSDPRTFTVTAMTDVVPPPAPTIIDPAEGSINRTVVVFRGLAEPGATAFVVEGSTAIGNGTADAAGRWEFAATLTGGLHTVTATARDRAGNVGPASAPRTFRVDATAPEIEITTPDMKIFLPTDELRIEGNAFDDLAVGSVSVRVENAVTGTLVDGRTASCDGCPGTSVTWHVTPDGLLPGLYVVRAWATDVGGNSSQSRAITILVI